MPTVARFSVCFSYFLSTFFQIFKKFGHALVFERKVEMRLPSLLLCLSQLNIKFVIRVAAVVIGYNDLQCRLQCKCQLTNQQGLGVTRIGF